MTSADDTRADAAQPATAAGPVTVARAPGWVGRLLAVGLVVALWLPNGSTRRWRWTSSAGRCSRSRSTCCSATPGCCPSGTPRSGAPRRTPPAWSPSTPGCRSRSRCSPAAARRGAARRADRLPGGAAHRHLLRDGHPGLRADGLLRRQRVALGHRRRERPAGRAAGVLRAGPVDDPYYFYYAALPIVLLGLFAAWRIVHSPFGRVLVGDPGQPGPGPGARLPGAPLQDDGVRPLGRSWPGSAAACSPSATASSRWTRCTGPPRARP